MTNRTLKTPKRQLNRNEKITLKKHLKRNGERVYYIIAIGGRRKRCTYILLKKKFTYYGPELIMYILWWMKVMGSRFFNLVFRWLESREMKKSIWCNAKLKLFRSACNKFLNLKPQFHNTSCFYQLFQKLLQTPSQDLGHCSKHQSQQATRLCVYFPIDCLHRV